jgi:hypothetical protein
MKINLLAVSVFFKTSLLLLCILSPNVGCKKIAREIKLTREQMVFAIDDAVTTIQNAPASWQTALFNLEEVFAEDLSTNLSERVSVLKNEVVGQVETGVICLMDAAASRAVLGLARLKAELLGEELPLPAPYLCSTSHYTIDLNLSQTIRREIIFYGFDFVQREKMLAILVKNSGTETYLDNSIHFLTNYQFVLNLAPYGDNLLKQYDYVSIRFEGEEISNIAIQQDNIPPLVQAAPPVVPPTFGYIPPLRQGDDEIGGSHAKVTLWTKLGHNRSQAYLQVYMSAYEQGGDRTAAYGWSDRHIFYTAPTGWHIKRIEGPGFYTIVSSRLADSNEENLDLELGQWTLFGCRKGSRIGQDTRVQVNFINPFTVIIEQDN